MATIPSGQKFHTIAADVDTMNRGSASANADRTIFTIDDIQSTIGSIGGSITAGQIAFGAATANNIEGNPNITTNGVSLFIPDYIVHTGDTNTFFGFNSDENFQVQTNGNVQIQVNENHVALYHKSEGEMIRTKNNGVLVTGQMDLAALNTAPAANDSAGTLGEIRWTEGFVYICTLTGADGAANWNRATLTSGW
tara:strand:+ start:287 stop:871 length:585 start_codon:yes stop_codon:yes gene_type:complete